jgi:hypothetical protein
MAGSFLGDMLIHIFLGTWIFKKRKRGIILTHSTYLGQSQNT